MLSEEETREWSEVTAFINTQKWVGWWDGWAYGTVNSQWDPRAGLPVVTAVVVAPFDDTGQEIPESMRYHFQQIADECPVEAIWDTRTVHQPGVPAGYRTGGQRNTDSALETLDALVEHVRNRYHHRMVDTRTYKLVNQLKEQMSGDTTNG